MAHPYQSQSKSSEKRRASALSGGHPAGSKEQKLISAATRGGLPSAGAYNGVGRLQKASLQRSKRR